MNTSTRRLYPRDVLFAFFLFSGFLKAVPALAGTVDLTAVGFAIVLVLVAFRVATRPLHISRPSRHFMLGFLLFVMVALLGYYFGDGGANAYKKLLQMAAIGGLYVVATPVLITDIVRLRAILGLIIFLGVCCGIVVVFSNDAGSSRGVLGGDEGSYQWLSRMSCYAMLSALGFAFAAKTRRTRFMLLACAVVAGISLFTGGARQALVASLVALGYLGYMLTGSSRGRAGRRTLLIAASLLLGFVVMFGAIFWSQANLAEARGVGRAVEFARLVVNMDVNQLMYRSDRTQIYQDAIRIFGINPVFGVGWGSFEFETVVPQIRHAHNVLLELLSEMGLIGLIAFATMLMPVLKICFNRARLASAGIHVAICGALFVAQLAMMMFSGDLGTNRLLYFFCILLLVTSRLESVRNGQRTHEVNRLESPLLANG